jgi:hypothetical protein
MFISLINAYLINPEDSFPRCEPHILKEGPEINGNTQASPVT